MYTFTALLAEARIEIDENTWWQTHETITLIAAVAGSVGAVCLLSCAIFCYRKKVRFDAARRSVTGGANADLGGGGSGGAVLEDGKPVSSCCDYVSLQD